MDKVQIYYLTMLVFGFIGAIYFGTQHPDKVVDTWGGRLAWYPVTLAVSLPMAGRIFGWW
jgi:hypothetical protein